jgi:hypothetical protein
MNKVKIRGIQKSVHELGADANTAMILIRELCGAILEEPEYPELKNDESKKWYSHPLYRRAGDII